MVVITEFASLRMSEDSSNSCPATSNQYKYRVIDRGGLVEAAFPQGRKDGDGCGEYQRGLTDGGGQVSWTGSRFKV